MASNTENRFQLKTLSFVSINKIINEFAWVFTISRPRFWTYLVGPWAVGMVCAATSFDDFSELVFWIGMLFFSWPANAFLYGINDYSDGDTDKFNPKKENYETRYSYRKNPILLTICIVIIIFSFAFWWLLPNSSSKIVFMIWLILSASYSLKPIRFKSRLFLDSLSNVLYILPGIMAFLVFNPLEYLSWPVVIAAWAWAMGMHLFSALPDINADKQAKVRTTAVWLGRDYAVLLTLLYYTVAVILCVKYLNLALGILGCFAYCFPTLYVLVSKDDNLLMSIYKKFPIINAFCGGCLFVYIFFEHNLLG